MRNIDEDPRLLEAVRRHHAGEITVDQLSWILGEMGYSEEEAEGALADFHWIHVRTPEIIKNILLPACLLCLLLLAVIALLRP